MNTPKNEMLFYVTKCKRKQKYEGQNQLSAQCKSEIIIMIKDH